MLVKIHGVVSTGKSVREIQKNDGFTVSASNFLGGFSVNLPMIPFCELMDHTIRFVAL